MFFSNVFFLHFYFTGYLICIDENVLLLWSWWQESLQGNEDMWSNSEKMNFVYLKVLFAEPKNEFSIISFLHYESQKKWKFWKSFETNLSLKCIDRVGVLINNTPVIQFSYKFEFILRKNWPTLTKTSKLSTVSHPLSSLKCFPWNSFESKDSFCCTNVKIKP